MKEPRVGWGLVQTNAKTFVCPGWYEVPNGTTRSQIEFKFKQEVIVKEVQGESKDDSWEVEGSKGAIYKVTLRNDKWDCSCPARQFRRGDCKHIKSIKETELV
jgi:hypothetical protein